MLLALWLMMISLAIVKKASLCFNCLGHHKVLQCGSKIRSKHCGCKHHSNLCFSHHDEPKQASILTTEHIAVASFGASTLANRQLPVTQVQVETQLGELIPVIATPLHNTVRSCTYNTSSVLTRTETGTSCNW